MMKGSNSSRRVPGRFFCLLGLLLIAHTVFAIVPIQEKSLQGAGAADARLRIIAAAESCLGVPYRYAGLNRRGLDCSGLVYLSFREGLNITVPRTAESIYAWAEKIPTAELAPGDLVFFITTGPGVSHLGIYAGNGRFIHSASEGPSTGVIYSRLNEPYWKRTYIGAGRALPWNKEAAQALAAARAGSSSRPPGNALADNSGGENAENVLPAVAWADPGFYTGFGAAWTWGGFFEGAPSIFRGFSAQAAVGYKWSAYRAGLEIRPEWDRALGVFRLPFTLSFGTDIFQVFAGPAYSSRDPSLSLEEGERSYTGGGSWLWEAGFSAALPPIRISQGALSFYGELAWQPYHWEEGETFSFKPDITANLRASTGVRYLWRL